MNIYEHFATYTNLPILLDTVCEQAKEYGVVDDFEFAEVDIDPDTLLGMHKMYRVRVPYGESRIIAQIFYSSAIELDSFRRCVCCKEILHALDTEETTAQSNQAVEQLIDSIVIPPSSGIASSSVASDHNGMLYALLILLPRDALAILRPKYNAGEISVEDVARLADIPDSYARLALSDTWQMIVDAIS